MVQTEKKVEEWVKDILELIEMSGMPEHRERRRQQAIGGIHLALFLGLITEETWEEMIEKVEY